LTDWQDVTRDEQRARPIQDDEPRQLLARIAGFNRPRRYKGCWDTFAWRSRVDASEFAFVQCKRAAAKATDLVGKDEEEWLRSALFLGDARLTLDSFCLVQWDYS
jgi:hypothetical protein